MKRSAENSAESISDLHKKSRQVLPSAVEVASASGTTRPANQAPKKKQRKKQRKIEHKLILDNSFKSVSTQR
jgi:hypothetical protein